MLAGYGPHLHHHIAEALQPLTGTFVAGTYSTSASVLNLIWQMR